MPRWVALLLRNISLWLAVTGCLIVFFEIFQHRLDRSSAIEAAIFLILGIVGMVWSWPRSRATSEKDRTE
jgi:hypothetical protein